MKNKSLQWRATVLVSILIAFICIIMNLLIVYTNTFYMDSIDEYIAARGNELQVQLDNSMENIAFSLDASALLDDYQRGFNAKSWAITLTLTAVGGILTYLISGIFLRPLHAFTKEIETVQIQNLSEPLKIEEAAPDICRLADSFNAMLNRLSLSFQSQRRFIDNAAHEFRTPLAIMQTKLELFQQKEEPTPGEKAEFLTALSSQIRNLSSLVKTLLEMSELQTAEMKEDVKLDEIIDEVLCDLDSLAEQRHITLSHFAEPFTLTGNDMLLSRMVFNLVENAIKYNTAGGTVRITLEKKYPHAVLRIQDSGMGIPENLWNEIMKPFFRVDKSRSRTMGGVGLGLALVREIAELHHGEIMVEESSEKGTVMAVYFLLSEKKRYD